jgi:hypothetical protein
MRGEPFTIPKPEPRKRVKGRKQRHAAKVVQSVRQQVVERDGYCRAMPGTYPTFIGDKGRALVGLCDGVSEWAHLGDKKRFKTRGQAPEVRHTTAGSLMLCTKHHQDYDAGRMVIEGDDANLPLKFERV